MSLNASKIKRPPRKPKAPALEDGVYPARVVIVAAIGLQDQGEWKGTKKPPAQTLLVTYECLDEFMPDEDGNEDREKPRWFSERFAMHPLDAELATSTKRYFSLDPTNEYGGDWSQLIGKACNLTLITNPDKRDETIVYNRIAGVSSMRSKDAERAPELVNDSVVFDIDDPDLEEFDKLPQWMQEVIQEGLDYDGSILERMLDDRGDVEDDEPKKEKKKKKKKSDDEDWAE